MSAPINLTDVDYFTGSASALALNDAAAHAQDSETHWEAEKVIRCYARRMRCRRAICEVVKEQASEGRPLSFDPIEQWGSVEWKAMCRLVVEDEWTVIDQCQPLRKQHGSFLDLESLQKTLLFRNLKPPREIKIHTWMDAIAYLCVLIEMGYAISEDDVDLFLMVYAAAYRPRRKSLPTTTMPMFFDAQSDLIQALRIARESVSQAIGRSLSFTISKIQAARQQPDRHLRAAFDKIDGWLRNGAPMCQQFARHRGSSARERQQVDANISTQTQIASHIHSAQPETQDRNVSARKSDKEVTRAWLLDHQPYFGLDNWRTEHENPEGTTSVDHFKAFSVEPGEWADRFQGTAQGTLCMKPNNMDIVLEVAGTMVDGDLPLLVSKQESKDRIFRPRFFTMRTSLDSQAPGIHLCHGAQDLGHLTPQEISRKSLSNDACFLISPDLCDRFDVCVISAKEDAQWFDAQLRSWGGLALDSNEHAQKPRRPNTDLALMEINLRLKPDTRLLCRVRAAKAESDREKSILDLVSNCTGLRLLTAFQGSAPAKQMAHFQHLIDLCMGTPSHYKMKTFWQYQCSYEEQGHNIHSGLPYATKKAKHPPPVPRWLYDEKDLAIFDAWSSSPSRPVIATLDQWISMHMISLGREMQILEKLVEHASSVFHTTHFYRAVPASHADFLFEVSLQAVVDQKLIPTEGQSLNIRWRQKRTTDDALLSPYIEATVTNQPPRFEGDLVLRLHVADAASQAEFLERQIRKYQHDTIEVNLMLTASLHSLKYQMQSLLQIKTCPPQPNRFHISRFLLTQPQGEFHIDLIAEFAKKTNWSNGSAISQRDREQLEREILRTYENANDEQRDFLNSSLTCCVHGYKELTGPPGCGKSNTGGAFAYLAALLDQRVIVCAQTNKAASEMLDKALLHAADTISPNLTQTRFRPTRLHCASANDRLRDLIWSKMDLTSIEGADVDLPGLSVVSQTFEAATAQSLINDPAILRYHKIIENAKRDIQRQRPISEMDKLQLQDAAEDAELAFLATRTLTFVTSDTLISYLRNGLVHSDITVVDEASLMTTLQFNAALQNNRACRMVIAAGDSQQINSKSQSAQNKANEFGGIQALSVFKEFLSLQIHRHSLHKNYRNPPIVISLLNRLSYKGLVSNRSTDSSTLDVIAKLGSMKDDKAFMQGVLADMDLGKPIVFFDVPGEPTETNLSTTSSSSGHLLYESTNCNGAKSGKMLQLPLPQRIVRFNQHGIDKCIAIVKDFTRKAKVSPSQMTILTPYRKDKDVMVENLKEASSENELKDVGVYTVDGFQGGEGEVVILHLVSAHPGALHYVGNRERLNVALTRPKQLLIVVGQLFELLRATQMGTRGQDLRTVINFITREGKVVYRNEPVVGDKKRKHNAPQSDSEAYHQQVEMGKTIADQMDY